MTNEQRSHCDTGTAATFVKHRKVRSCLLAQVEGVDMGFLHRAGAETPPSGGDVRRSWSTRFHQVTGVDVRQLNRAGAGQAKQTRLQCGPHF